MVVVEQMGKSDHISKQSKQKKLVKTPFLGVDLIKEAEKKDAPEKILNGVYPARFHADLMGTEGDTSLDHGPYSCRDISPRFRILWKTI